MYAGFLKAYLNAKGSNHIYVKDAVSPQSGGVFVFDNENVNYNDRKNFVEYFSKEQVTGGIFKEHLFYVNHRAVLLVLCILNTLWFPFLFLFSLFKKDKAAVANLFKEQLECYNLINVLESNGVNLIYHFCIYEKDSNINTLLLQSRGIKVNKIPSEVPLGIWNKTIIADKLCLCMGYQYDELKVFKNSVFINEVVMFGPENCLINIQKYKQPVNTEKGVVGFYSTGAWIRSLENHKDQGYDMEGSEEMVKRFLRDFCMANPEYRLMVFLHPRERWDKYKQAAYLRYREMFGAINYQLAEENTPSSLLFEKADVGVAFLSTIVYERLYYGFKTLIMPVGTPSFPVENSNMKNICLENKDQFDLKLKSSLMMSNTEFFNTNGISHYANYLFN